MATAEAFIYMSSLIQKYEMKPGSNDPIPLDGHMNGVSRVPAVDLRVKFVPRKVE